MGALSKQKQEYEKRKEKAQEKKRENLERKAMHADDELESSMHKFQQVQKNRKSLEVCQNRNIEAHRNKIAVILLRAEEQKYKERERK